MGADFKLWLDDFCETSGHNSSFAFANTLRRQSPIMPYSGERLTCYCTECMVPLHGPCLEDDAVSLASGTTVTVARPRRPASARVLDMSSPAGPLCVCGSPQYRHDPHLVSPASTSPQSLRRTPSSYYYSPLMACGEEARAMSLAPMLLPPSMHEVSPVVTPLCLRPLPEPVAAESAELRSSGPLLGLDPPR